MDRRVRVLNGVLRRKSHMTTTMIRSSGYHSQPLNPLRQDDSSRQAGEGKVVVITSGKGGVGKSTVTAR